MITIEERFWSKVDRTAGADGCWPWTGSKFPTGYGCFQFASKDSKRAHRVAFFLEHGWWPPVVLHSCDNPPCVNPAHLVAGTQMENIADRHSKGRSSTAAAVAAAAKARSAATACKRGHDVNDVNTRIDPAGKKRCRVCDRARGNRKVA